MAKAGVPVTFLVRPNRYQQLSTKGLHIKSIHGDFSIQPKLVDSPNQIENQDVAILAMKNYHLQDSLPQLDDLVKQGVKLLPLLNGIAHMELLINRYGKENVLGGLCYMESTLDEDGRIVQTSPMQDIVFGSIGELSDDWLNDLKDTLLAGGFHVRKSSMILAEMWQKFIFLVSLSGITSVLRNPIGVALADPVANDFLKKAIQEIITVAKAKEIPISENTGEQVYQKLTGINPNMTSSMHRDLEKGLPLELESLQGAVIQMANELNIQVPSIQAIYSLLHPFKK